MRQWWLIAWTAGCFGCGILAASVGWHRRPDDYAVLGGVVLLLALLLLAHGWWRETVETRRRTREMARRPRIVAIGGGTGLSVILRGLKEFPVDLTAVVTVADDGGSSGRLRSDLAMPPPGDIRNCLVALADTEPLLERLLQFRFPAGEGLAGHSFGNLFLAAMTHIMGDFESAIRETSRVLAVRGRVLPAVREDVKLRAILEDGSVVEGESNIPKAGKRIERVELVPADARPLPEVLQAIQEADAIVVGPGSLYTSVLPNLLVPGLADAIAASQAKKIYVCNVMTQPGETDHFTASQHVEVIYRHVGRRLFDYILVNAASLPEEALAKYRAQNAHPVFVDIEALARLGLRVIARNFVHYATYARHDSRLIAEQVVSLIGYERRKEERSWLRQA
ncbi:gluconeogenesis factor [Alicyclobacillus cellulosilyticus]|uniref:Gluconeogenesis factor n=2 Tax=Alicyclobacillus cellulosilyticus TaxID=1003997 RepID=A0A917NJF4_9BACL|nr:YvcK family protein [Alicyclobacillus cellulosilyticus]GGJ05773.1 gluconeogenesis factor [Alicyclobacillus cellulosilyticus]